MQNFPRILQNYLIFNAFFSKILVKSQKNFEKSQENFSKRSGKSQEKSGKISQLDLWQPCYSVVVKDNFLMVFFFLDLQIVFKLHTKHITLAVTFS